MNAAAMIPRSLTRWTVVSGFLLAVAASTLLLAALPSSAQAGSYAVIECQPYGHEGVPDAVYSTNGALAFTPANNCTGGGYPYLAIGTTGSGWAGPLTAHWSFTAPPGTLMGPVTFQRAAYTSGTFYHLVAVCGSSGCSGYSNDTGWSGVAFIGNWPQLIVNVACGYAGPYCNAGTYLYTHTFNFTMTDYVSPQISSLRGSLLEPGPRRGTEGLSVAAADTGGGVHRLSVRVNGAEIASAPQGCSVDGAGVGYYLQPCSTSRSASFSVNTESAPWVEGSNRLEVCAYDYATGSSPNSGCAQRTVLIDNTCANSAGGVQATDLSAGLQKSPAGPLQPTLAVRSSRGATVRGTLSGPSGPVGAASVCLYEKVDLPGDTRRLAQVTKTKADGTFAIQVEPGPSRVFDVVYRYNNQVVERGQLYLDSVVKPTLKVRPKGGIQNGESARFIGQLPGPNAEDRAVGLQARAGRKWRTFKQLTTNERGKFKGRYRFTNTRGRATYKFRALVKKQGSYPYSPGASGKKKVRVRG